VVSHREDVVSDSFTKELPNWEPEPVFVDGRYISSDTWYDGDGTPVSAAGAFSRSAQRKCTAQPYTVSDMKTSARSSMSTAYPRPGPSATPNLSPSARRPSGCTRYTATTARTHRGAVFAAVPWPAVSHEPRIQQISYALAQGGYHPFQDEQDGQC